MNEEELFALANNSDLLFALTDAENDVKSKNPLKRGYLFETIGERKILINRLLEAGFKIEKIKK